MLIESGSYRLIDSSDDWKDSQEFSSLVEKIANERFDKFFTLWKERRDATGINKIRFMYHLPGRVDNYKPTKQLSDNYQIRSFTRSLKNECNGVLFPNQSMRHYSAQEQKDRKSKFYHDLAKQVACNLGLKFKDIKERIGKEFEYDVTLFNPKTKDKFCPHIKITAKLVPGKFRSLGFLSDLVFSSQKDEESSE